MTFLFVLIYSFLTHSQDDLVKVYKANPLNMGPVVELILVNDSLFIYNTIHLAFKGRVFENGDTLQLISNDSSLVDNYLIKDSFLYSTDQLRIEFYLSKVTKGHNLLFLRNRRLNGDFNTIYRHDDDSLSILLDGFEFEYYQNGQLSSISSFDNFGNLIFNYSFNESGGLIKK